MTPVCLVIADDHPMVRRALAEALREEVAADCQILEAGSVAACREILARTSADLLLLDLNMPGMDGLQGLQGLRGEFPAVPILVVSATEDADVTRRALEAGASGFLPKSSPITAIGAAVNAVLQGEIWVPAGLQAGPVAGSMPRARESPDLTPQQHRVLALLAEGKLNKEIAFELAVTEATVKAHMTQIFRKLGVQTRTQAALVARRLTDR